MSSDTKKKKINHILLYFAVFYYILLCFAQDLALENKDVCMRQASHGLKIRSVCCCSDAGLISDHLCYESQT